MCYHHTQDASFRVSRVVEANVLVERPLHRLERGASAFRRPLHLRHLGSTHIHGTGDGFRFSVHIEALSDPKLKSCFMQDATEERVMPTNFCTTTTPRVICYYWGCRSKKRSYAQWKIPFPISNYHSYGRTQCSIKHETKVDGIARYIQAAGTHQSRRTLSKTTTSYT